MNAGSPKSDFNSILLSYRSIDLPLTPSGLVPKTGMRSQMSETGACTGLIADHEEEALVGIFTAVLECPFRVAHSGLGTKYSVGEKWLWSSGLNSRVICVHRPH